MNEQEGREVGFKVRWRLGAGVGCAGLAACHTNGCGRPPAWPRACSIACPRWQAGGARAQSRFLMTFSTTKKPASAMGPMAQNTPVRAMSQPGVESMGMICRPGAMGGA